MAAAVALNFFRSGLRMVRRIQWQVRRPLVQRVLVLPASMTVSSSDMLRSDTCRGVGTAQCAIKHALCNSCSIVGHVQPRHHAFSHCVFLESNGQRRACATAFLKWCSNGASLALAVAVKSEQMTIVNLTRYHLATKQAEAHPYSSSKVSATLARNRELNQRWKNSNFSSPPSTSVITDLQSNGLHFGCEETTEKCAPKHADQWLAAQQTASCTSADMHRAFQHARADPCRMLQPR